MNEETAEIMDKLCTLEPLPSGDVFDTCSGLLFDTPTSLLAHLVAPFERAA